MFKILSRFQPLSTIKPQQKSLYPYLRNTILLCMPVLPFWLYNKYLPKIETSSLF